MTYAEAVELLMRLSGWKRSEVERDATDALWAASSKLVEARDVIEAAKDQQRTRR